jgi:anthranilate synthase component 1
MRPPYLVRELPAAAEPSARLLALHAAAPARYPVLLDSAVTGTPLARHSLLLAAPGPRLVLDAEGRLSGPGRGRRFCERLDDWWRESAQDAPPPHGPFAGGWFLYLGYELAAEVEPTLRLPRSPLPIVAMAWRMQAALLLDHESGRVSAVAEAAAGAALKQLCEDWRASAPLPPPALRAAPAVEEEDPQRYLAACRRALRHIAAGDIYQANLARCWRAALPEGVTAPALYARLREANPGAFAGIVQFDDLAVLSSSPERLVRVRGRQVDTRPIAGTRPRTGADADAIAAMTGSAKERAEHVMLIDLERNDLGRICEAGTVRVDEFMAVESYAHVHHGRDHHRLPEGALHAADRGTRRPRSRRLHGCDGLPDAGREPRPQHPDPYDDAARRQDRTAGGRRHRRGFEAGT